MSENFEELYNKLKEEYEASKKDNDELCKEYESTIEMLTESVDNFKKEKEVLEKKLSKLEQEQKSFKKEKESLISKNKDKITDIQNLNKQNDRLSSEIKRLKEEKTLFDTKIVTLENDNEHFQNKIREYEALAEDLENQLESALEENITLQTEFETYKQTTGDQLIRKDEELRDVKNDLSNKDKFIQRLQRGNNALLVKNIQKNFKEGGNLPQRRRFTLLPGGGGGNNDLLAFQRTLGAKGLLDNNEENNKDKVDKPALREAKTFSESNSINNRFKQRNSLFSPGFGALAQLVKKKEELKKSVASIGSNGSGKKESKFLTQMREKSNKSLLSNNSGSILSEQKLAEKIDEKSEKSEISEDEKEFKELKITQENNFDFISIGNNNKNNVSNGANSQFRILGNEQAIIDNLQKLLERIRKRKVKLIDKRKSNRERIKKLKQN